MFYAEKSISFILSGLIEIDGHIFKNDTCRRPIYYHATLDKVTLIDPVCGNEYEHRTCKVEGCKVIHLVEKNLIIGGSIGIGGNTIIPGWGRVTLNDGTTLLNTR